MDLMLTSPYRREAKTATPLFLQTTLLIKKGRISLRIDDRGFLFTAFFQLFVGNHHPPAEKFYSPHAIRYIFASSNSNKKQNESNNNYNSSSFSTSGECSFRNQQNLI